MAMRTAIAITGYAAVTQMLMTTLIAPQGRSVYHWHQMLRLAPLDGIQHRWQTQGAQATYILSVACWHSRHRPSYLRFLL